MKLQIKKDVNARIRLNLVEKNFIVLKYVIKNLIKYENNLKLLKKIRFILSKKIKTFTVSKTQIVRKCLITGRSRSTTRSFNLSRIKMRELIKNGSIKHISKRSW
jgi:ribosomal protein S14